MNEFVWINENQAVNVSHIVGFEYMGDDKEILTLILTNKAIAKVDSEYERAVMRVLTFKNHRFI